ncbi:Hypothetical predicted protein [Paramuricea clavata]|uniref:Uncharacterized protein n=1 Tax=Paramuricea clavata TaxID=317549 RepID=A0A7D9DUW8_PARCT|nr:Hypothetical predicted protein [Paramuricea clavata]
MNANAVALLGHASHQLSMHQRQAIKPFLNKEYATLCSPQSLVTEFLFGDELQSQLNNIKASNKIGNNDDHEASNKIGNNDDHEVLWCLLRPKRLPRGFSHIIAAVVYHPPDANY